MRIILSAYEKDNKKNNQWLDRELRAEDVVVTTSSNNFLLLKERFPQNKIEYINFLSDEFFGECETIINQIVDQLSEAGISSAKNELPYITINHLYDPMVRPLVNTVHIIDDIIHSNNVTEICLFGGSRSIPFWGINLGEGERHFQFLYRREWFINYFVYHFYATKVSVQWFYEDWKVGLKLAANVRLFALNFAKSIKMMQTLTKNDTSMFVDKNKEWAYIVVRAPQTVETMVPIYNGIKKQQLCQPIFVAYENFSNKTLQKELEKYSVLTVNLKGYLKRRDIIKTMFFLQLHSFKTKEDLSIVISDYEIKIKKQSLINELKTNWFDSMLLSLALDRLKADMGGKVKYLINAETHSWVAATQGIWAKKNGIMSIGVPFVDLDIRPRTSWMDVYFQMSRKEKEFLEKNRPKEKFEYVGPLNYDYVYNTSSHKKGELKKIAIFTQPDSFKNDAFEMIEAFIDIRNRHQKDWEIIVKLHPRETKVDEFRKYEEYEKVRIIYKEITSLAVLQDVDLAVSVHSTVLEQAILVGIPILSVNFGGIHYLNLRCLQAKIANKVQTKDEMEQFVLHFDEIDEEYEKTREEYVLEAYGDYHGDGVKKMLEYLRKEDVLLNETRDK